MVSEEVSKFAAKDLTRGITRNGPYELNLAWLFVVSEAVGDEGA